MYPGMQLDLFEQWLPRRAVLQVALWIWATGFVVAGATAWRMHHPTMGTEQTTRIAADVEGTPTEGPADGAESERVVLMPIAVIVGLRTPKVGVALRQKP
jgi:hypothetical protein